MRYAALLLLLAGMMAGCTRPDNAIRILSEQGYTQIEITGWRPFACDEKDTFSTGFKAVNASGHEVAGVVCEGILKNATIRFD